MKFLYILLFLGCLVYDVTGSTICKPELGHCEGNGCYREQKCDHGTCAPDGSCDCSPCFQGDACTKFVDDQYPGYLKEEDEIDIDPSHKGLIYEAKAVDADTYTTCLKDVDEPCPCGRIYYEVVGTYGSLDSPFFVDHDNGNVMLREGAAIRAGEVYTVEIAASNYAEEEAFETGFLSLDYFKIRIRVRSSNAIDGLFTQSQLNSLDTERQKYAMELNSPMTWNEEAMEEEEAKEDNFIVSNQRVKRESPGTAFSDTDINLSIVTDNSDVALDPGESVTFKIAIILPTILVSAKMDLLVEIFVMDAVTGLTTMALCDVQVTSIGSLIKNSGGSALTSDDVTITNFINAHFNTFNDRATLDFGSVYNVDAAGDGSSASLSTIEIEFQAIMIHNAAFVSSDAIVTAGAEYNDENYVWVSQATFSYASVAMTFPSSIDMKGPTTIPQGSGGTFDIKGFITHSFGDLELEIYSPSNTADEFSVTSLMLISKGDNHACAFPLETRLVQRSASGKTVHRMFLGFPLLVRNLDHRDALAGENALEANALTFSFTVEMVDAVEAAKISVGAGIKIGDSSLWTGSVDITIGSPTGNPALVPITVVGYNVDDRTTPPTVATAGTVVYGLRINLNPPGTPTKITCNAEPGATNKIAGVNWGSSSKFASSFPDLLKKVTYDDITGQASWVVEVKNGHTDTVDQGPRTAANEFVVIEVTQVVNAHANTGTIDCDGTVFTMTAQAGPAPTQDMTGTVTQLGNDNKWYEGSQAGFLAKLTYPPNGVSYDTTFETSADLTTTAFGSRVCAVEILKIGRGIGSAAKGTAQLQDIALYTKALSGSAFDDSMSAHFGVIGGAYLSDAATGDDEFYLRVTYDIPLAQSPAVAATTGYKLSIGAMLDTTQIWTGFALHDVATGVPPEDTTKLALFTVAAPTFPTVEQIPQIIKATIKSHPGSVAKYKVTVTSANSLALQICRVVLLNIGGNYPCTNQYPYGKELEPEQTVILTHGADWVTSAVLDLGILRNMGDSSIYGTAIADEDSIEIGIIVKPILPSTTTTLTIAYDDGRTTAVADTEVDVVTGATAFTPATSQTIVMIIYGRDNTFDFYENVMKEVEVKLTVPATYDKVTYLEVVSETPLDLGICYAAVFWVGMNVPCLIPSTVLTERSVGVAEEEIYKLDLISICHLDIILDDVTENDVYIRIGVMVTEGIPTASFKVKFYAGDAVAEAEEVSISKSLSAFVLAPFDSATVIVTAIDVAPVTTVEPGDRMWIGVYLEIPLFLTIPVELSVLADSVDGQAHATVHGFRWGDTQGKNIACPQPLEMYMYDLHQNGSNDSVAMIHESQTDALTVSLKHLTNTGITQTQFTMVAEDNKAMIEADIWIGDHSGVVSGGTINIGFAIKVGSTIICLNKELTLQKPATPNVMVLKKEFYFADPAKDSSTTYTTGEQIYLTGRVQHVVNESHIEGYETKLRLMLPSYVKHVPAATTPDQLSVDIDYTLINSNYIDMDITNLFFTDIVEFNISLTVDPNNDMPKGLGLLNSTALFRVVCKESNTGNPAKYCGTTSFVNYLVEGTECFEDLLVSAFTACQFKASTAIDSSVDADKAVTAGGWSPAVRNSALWGHHISVDFLRKTRVTKIVFTAVAGTPRGVATYKLMISYDGVSYIEACSEILYASVQRLPSACRIETRYARIKILSTDTVNEEMAIGVSFLLYGCELEAMSAAGTCTFTPTQLTTNVDIGWRHMALDPVNNILYFCDYNPKKKRMVCYSSSDGTTWNALPSYLNSLAGFDEGTALMYAWDAKKRAMMASADGVKWSLVDSAAVLSLTNPSAIPGGPKDGFSPVTVGDWTADFDGITLSGVRKVNWNNCCT